MTEWYHTWSLVVTTGNKCYVDKVVRVWEPPLEPSEVLRPREPPLEPIRVTSRVPMRVDP